MGEISKYILENSTEEGELLRELDRQTHLRVLNPRMISGHVQGRLLEMFVRMIRPRRVLEIGTFTGYSTLCMAAGLAEDGGVVPMIDTLEIDDELEALASSFFARSKHSKYIRQHVGDALEIIPKLYNPKSGGGERNLQDEQSNQPFDLVFIDGDKRQYPDYLRVVVPVVRHGGFILADNVLWYGKVAAPAVHGDLHTARLQEFNRMVLEDSMLENVIIPLRDGINVIRKL